MAGQLPVYHLENEYLRVEIASDKSGDRAGYFVRRVELRTPAISRILLEGRPGCEFVTRAASMGASECDVRRLSDGTWTAILSGRADGWTAREVLVLPPGEPYVKRVQTYTFLRNMTTAICPGFVLPSAAGLRYTFALRAHERAPADLPPLRAAVDWAVPFPFHAWHVDGVVAIYGLDKRCSRGTLDFTPPGARNGAILSVYYPDHAGTDPGAPRMPDEVCLPVGTSVTMTEIIAAKLLADGDEPLLEAERLAGAILLQDRPPVPDAAGVADRIARFYPRCELWEPDAFGPGQGWFSNMWVRTQTGPARKRGEMSGYYDLGWGEGIAVEAMLGMVRHWKRTGETDLLPFVDSMTQSLDRYKRAPGDAQPYFDRSDGTRFGDFLMDVVPGSRIWTHALGHTGSQLLQIHQAVPDYPRTETRAGWLAAASGERGQALSSQLGGHWDCCRMTVAR